MVSEFKVFCCYARKDHMLLQELKNHLMPLQKQGLINVWADTNITPGSEWEKEIDQQLDLAQIILLLISPDFMASNYCYSKEMAQALNKHKKGEACVIPVILRSVSWQETPIGKLQALPTNVKPIKEWSSKDKAFLDVTEGIRLAVKKLSIRQQLPKQTISAGPSPSTPPINQFRSSQPPIVTQHSSTPPPAQAQPMQLHTSSPPQINAQPVHPQIPSPPAFNTSISFFSSIAEDISHTLKKLLTVRQLPKQATPSQPSLNTLPVNQPLPSQPPLNAQFISWTSPSPVVHNRQAINPLLQRPVSNQNTNLPYTSQHRPPISQYPALNIRNTQTVNALKKSAFITFKLLLYLSGTLIFTFGFLGTAVSITSDSSINTVLLGFAFIFDIIGFVISIVLYFKKGYYLYSLRWFQYIWWILGETLLGIIAIVIFTSFSPNYSKGLYSSIFGTILSLYGFILIFITYLKSPTKKTAP